MHKNAHGSRASYQRGCRCDQCKCAESEYRKALRQLWREEIGLVPASDTHEMSLVTDADNRTLTSGDAGNSASKHGLAVLA